MWVSPLVNDYTLKIWPFLVFTFIIFLIGEIIYAERRERIIPVRDSLLKMNRIIKDPKEVHEILKELTSLLNCEVTIAISRIGQISICSKKIGQPSYSYFTINSTPSKLKNLFEWLIMYEPENESNWKFQYQKRTVMANEISGFFKDSFKELFLSKIISIIFKQLPDDKGYLIALNNINANGAVLKPFTKDRYELLEMASTVVDDHQFYNPIPESSSNKNIN